MVPSVKPITGTKSQNGFMSSEADVDRTELEHKVSDKPEDKEETEHSSSFDATDSTIENLESDSEVVSDVHHDLGLGFDDLRRKKLTLQWRTFIQPVMWRCKWLELQVNRCNAQALKYDKEIAAYDAKNKPPSDNLNQEGGSCVNPSPMAKMMRRNKRRKIEDVEDIGPYMSNHNLFSYEGKQTRPANGARVDIDLDIQEKINVDEEEEFVDTSWLQLEDDNILVENKLRKLDFLKSKVKNLRSRMNKVKSKNAERLSLADELEVLLASTTNEPSSLVRSLGSSLPKTTGGRRVKVPSQNGNGGGGAVGLLTGEGCAGSSSGNAAADGQSGLMAKGKKVKVENDIEEDEIALNESDLVNEDQPVHRTRSVTKITATKGKKKKVKRRGSSSRWSRR